ncbi:probable glucan endo-1,3-beta-glucosidase A6 isoform X2 [Benincasa hispida]|uniref:probable glucan endo-1,3-beta-glucosidase A6 isoform X2 n=1 Tax=Benincasa hispida TaxID=102211 RepID=UPI0018FFFB5F|nr:probable glucan endo-1,3-beta-glucosidase A6 isoform X2 [Benincasa hispida]
MATFVLSYLILFFSLLFISDAEISSKIGINYGQLGNNLPPPNLAIEMMNSMKVGRVKLYDANHEILSLLSRTKLQVSIMIPNNEISDIANNQTRADQWILNNVVPFYPNTMIRFILVGNEVLSYDSDMDRQVWNDLVPAMRRIWSSLKANNLQQIIRVGTPVAMDVLETAFPPSRGTFRSDIRRTVVAPMLDFLNETRSFFFADVYPYFSWSANPMNIDLDFALFNGNFEQIDGGSGLVYTNLLDEMLDSLIFAMAKLGYPDIRLVISETGWPTTGDIEEPGANLLNAATYNRNLVKRITAKPTIGTPARPGVVIPTFIFALFNENQKSGPGTERHWGLLSSDGSPNYQIDLTGKKSSVEYDPLPVVENNVPFRGRLWCVAARGVDLMELGAAVDDVCGGGDGTCEALSPGRECYEPVSVYWHASYAFSSYWSKFRSQGANCYFNGLAEQTTIDPSNGSCRFPSVTF